MKKAIVTMATLMAAQSSFAANLMCGANTEKVKGSQVYDKPVFWNQNSENKNQLRFLLPDGTVVDGNGIQSAELMKIPNDSVAMTVSFDNKGRVSLSVSKVKKDIHTGIRFQESALAGSFTNEAILTAHGVSLICKEL